MVLHWRYIRDTQTFPQNKSNFDAHFEGTGPEIWRQTNGTVDAFVAGAGEFSPFFLSRYSFTSSIRRCGQWVAMVFGRLINDHGISSPAEVGDNVPPFPLSHPHEQISQLPDFPTLTLTFWSHGIFACYKNSAHAVCFHCLSNVNANQREQK